MSKDKYILHFRSFPNVLNHLILPAVHSHHKNLLAELTLSFRLNILSYFVKALPSCPGLIYSNYLSLFGALHHERLVSIGLCAFALPCRRHVGEEVAVSQQWKPAVVSRMVSR